MEPQREIEQDSVRDGIHVTQDVIQEGQTSGLGTVAFVAQPGTNGAHHDRHVIQRDRLIADQDPS